MAGVEMSLDLSDFSAKASLLRGRLPGVVDSALQAIAEEIMRLSQREVPLDSGYLQNTGSVQSYSKGKIVGYNTPYAARLHEHPEYHFRNGRKGKYLEDPIKNNITVLRNYFGSKMKAGLGGHA